MMKFFRKYNKHLLAVFMALLLIVWLADEAIRNILRPDEMKTVVAQAYGRDIRQRDLLPTFTSTGILSALGVAWQQMARVSMADLGVPPMMAMSREPLTEREWYMLVSEARRQGIVVSPDTVNKLKASLPQADRVIEYVRDTHRVSLAQVDEAIADFLRVREAALRAASGVLITEPEIRQRAKLVAEKVRVEFVVLPAAPFIDSKAPIDESKLKAFFEEHKDFPPGAGPGLGYGYKKPAAVQYEYVQADVDALARAIEVSGDTAYAYWREHKAEFKRSEPPATGAASKPAASAPAIMTFEEARPLVVAKLQQERAKQEALRLVRDLISELGQPWTGAAAGPDGYLKAPAGVEADNYLSAHLDAFAKRRFGSALRYQRSGWQTETELSREKGIATARLTDSQTPMMFRQAVFQVQGLAPKPATTKTGSEYYLARYQLCPSPLTDAHGNVYAYRVIGTQPSAPPASLDEVRAQVEKDYREKEAFEAAGRAAEALRAKAAQSGLAAAWEADVPLRERLGKDAKLEKPAPFAQQELYPMRGQAIMLPTRVPPIGDDPAFVRECFRLAEAKTSTQPQRVGVVEMRRARQWVVVQGLEILPIYQDQYDEVRLEIAATLRADALGRFLQNYYSPDEIRRRAQWKDLQPERG